MPAWQFEELPMRLHDRVQPAHTAVIVEKQRTSGSLLECCIDLEGGVVPSQQIAADWDRWVAASPAGHRAASGVARERRSEAR